MAVLPRLKHTFLLSVFLLSIFYMKGIFAAKEETIANKSVFDRNLDTANNGEMSDQKLTPEEGNFKREAQFTKSPDDTTATENYDNLQTTLNIDSESNVLTTTQDSLITTPSENSEDDTNIDLNNVALTTESELIIDNDQLKSSIPKEERIGIQGDVNTDENFLEQENKNTDVLLPSEFSKRILLSPPTPKENADNAQVEQLPKGHLDSWRPVWPFPKLGALPLQPTVPESSLHLDPVSTRRPSVSKEPVTAYYFDLSSVIPTKQVGPLYDPSHLRTVQHTATTTQFVDNTYQSLSSSFHKPDLPAPETKRVYLSTYLGDQVIEPTPTLNTLTRTREMTNFNQSHSDENSKSEVLSPQSSEPVAISSIYNSTSPDLQNSTPAYTLGNSTDFLFTHGSDLVQNSTNTSDPDILSSSLSSDQPLENESSTGDPSNKNKQINSASLYKIPIDPTDLPTAISLSSIGSSTQENMSVIPSLSSLVPRIPLWKRLSQSKTISDSSLHTKTSFPSIHMSNINSFTSVTHSSIPFENDIPIGILSPGILKYPTSTTENDSIRKDASILKDSINSLKIDNKQNTFINFPSSSPSLESSLQTFTTNNDESFMHTVNTLVTTVHSDVEISSSNLDYSDLIINSPNMQPVSPSSTIYSLSSISSTTVNYLPSNISSSRMNEENDSKTATSFSTISASLNDIPSFYSGDRTLTPAITNTYTSSQALLNNTLVNLGDINNNLTPNTVLTAQTAQIPTQDHKTLSEDKNLPEIVNIDANIDISNSSIVIPLENSANVPKVNYVNTTSLSNIADLDFTENPDNENYDETLEITPQIISNENSSISNSLDNSSVKFTDIDLQTPMNSSVESNLNETNESKSPVTDEGFISSTINTIDQETDVPIGEEPAVFGVFNATNDGGFASGVSTSTSSSTSTTEAIAPETFSHSISTSTRRTPSSISTLSTTDVPMTKTGPSTTTSKSTSDKNYESEEHETHLIDETPTYNNKSSAGAEKQNPDSEEKVFVIISSDPGGEPELNLIKMHENGTNTTNTSPFIKAAVSYDILEFCQHQKKIEALLSEWINSHFWNSSEGTSATHYEVEIFYQPDCENLYIHNDDSQNLENRTDVYFYVKQNGKISANSTLNYPRNPTNLEISQELEYLRKKILHLELMNASSSEDLLIEEAAVGTSIIVIVVVTTFLIIILVGAILAFFVIKRRRSAENVHGRRCTPAATDAYSLDSVSVFYHSLRRKSKKRASNKSLKSYLNQGFEDPNLPSRPLNFAKLTHFITDNEAVYDEFSNIPSVVPKYDEMPRGVEDKNRYANVIPVPETRILLGGNKLSPSAEYINANSIHGPRGELRYYIATQAPLDNTVADFWQMVWEQESKVIVMLTDFVEKGIDKCADYLPPSETLDCHRVYGEFQITLKSRDMREKYIVSLLQIKNLENNLVREIAHMWYTGWPSSGVPNEEKLFISFIFDVRTTRKQLRAKGPMIVHCSPGTGRTGTYIACDLCMRQFDEQKVVDIPKTAFRIRRERAGAIQTKEQYFFIYRVVNLYAAKLTTGNLDSF